MKSLVFEKNIGIETYFTEDKGIDGKLRYTPEDFIVRELYLYPKKEETGNYVIAEVSCRNWETHTLIRELAKRLHISRKRIGFAGTKDKRALSTQLMSFYDVSNEELSKIKIKDVLLNNIYSSDKPIKLGDLYGNYFETTIRKINNELKSEQIGMKISFLNGYGGFPNYYGVQRFGVVRPITHVVGKHIVDGDFEKAVMTYIANPIEGENDETFELRKELEKSRDYSKALHSYPDQLNFEKAILNKLVVEPKDFVGALKELPRNLLTMFINAYQSYLFNKILSERIERKMPLNQAIVGDIILPLRISIKDKEGILVTKSNIEKVNMQTSKKKAFVSGLLVGSDSVFADGEMGEIEHKIIDKEKIDKRDFIIPEMPFISSSGSRRSLFAPLSKIDWTMRDDELNDGHQELTLKFELPKGCYATSLLREFMKSEDIKNY